MVRSSITNPDIFIEENLVSFYNILEVCLHSYDNGVKVVERLVYVVTKKSNELLAHAYSKLYNIP